jgi:hypothetical protein
VTQDELFDRLTSNAIDFVLGAIDQVRSQPKYSIINFYAAVELFLKARLLREHWSLVVNKEPDLTRFESGDFQSVTFEEACIRLAKIVGSPVPDPARKAFDAVRKHRNRMVHFFHQAKDSTIETVVAEQLRAWYYLNELLTVQWSAVFEAYKDQLGEIERKLQDHRAYLTAKFEGLSETIAQRKKQGINFANCPSCGFDAAEVHEVLGALSRNDCLVCGVKTDSFDWECPVCGEVSQQSDGASLQCDKCGNQV